MAAGNNILDAIRRNWKWLVGVLVFILVAVAIWYWWKKKNENTVQVVDDSGNPVQISAEDTGKANLLAAQLKADIEGWNYGGHDDAIYQDLLAQSNTVFALTLAKYKELTGSYLTVDMKNEYYGVGGWDIVDVIITRATDLNIQ